MSRSAAVSLYEYESPFRHRSYTSGSTGLAAARRARPAAVARHLRGLESLLDKPLLKALVLSSDRDARAIEPGVLALPAAWALGGG